MSYTIEEIANRLGSLSAAISSVLTSKAAQRDEGAADGGRQTRVRNREANQFVDQIILYFEGNHRPHSEQNLDPKRFIRAIWPHLPRLAQQKLGSEAGTYQRWLRRRRKRAKALAKKKEKHAQTAKNALAIWSIATSATKDNPYCHRKGIEPTETLREIDADKVATVLGYVPSARNTPLEGRLLVVPIKVGDKFSSLQLIDGAGSKHFLHVCIWGSDGRYWATQELPDSDDTGIWVLIGEGVATVLSARQAVPSALGVAPLYNVDIHSVARLMRQRYPRADIVVLADVHKKTAIWSIEEAAGGIEAIGGRLAVPRFDDGPAPDRKDFNDMLRVHGAEAVRAAIEAAKVPVLPLKP